MKIWRALIVIPPSARLDERIRGLFPPGAMYDCEPGPMDTLVERRMRQISSNIRSKSDWVELMNDSDTRAGWSAEAKVKELTDVEFTYVLDELAYYASLRPLGSNIRLSAADGVWLSDTLIDAETTNKLKDYASILESVPDRQKDWYPNDRSRVLNLIDPSLYPLIYSRSKLCRQSGTSPLAALKLVETGEFPGSLDGWCKALTFADNGESDYYIPLPAGDKRYCYYSSDKFSWLPSEFRVDDNGAVTIESYINNLHPVRHAALYPVIASIFSKSLPLLEQVVTDLVYPRRQRVIPDRHKYYKSEEPMPDENDCDYYRWKEGAEFVHPQPEPFVPTRPVNPYQLHGRRLQAIVKMTSIELTSKRPIYGGEDWGLVGLANERIIATGIFFYDVANIAPASLRFREALSYWDFEANQFDIRSVVNAYGIEEYHLAGCDPVSQELGSIEIKDGRCLVFPNLHQYKVPELKLADKTKLGHCKMLTFYFVDPSTHIPSTEIVPPQQQDWYFADILASEPFRSLPHLVVEGIMNEVDFPISLKEAKKIRLEMAEEESFKSYLSGSFEPDLYFSA
ncbi:hypothetical protein GGI08_002522 [Coemansia sp. S2]|nr:hypothetical protein GGI08_002522 [Coemansia sp. S2]